MATLPPPPDTGITFAMEVREGISTAAGRLVTKKENTPEARIRKIVLRINLFNLIRAGESGNLVINPRGVILIPTRAVFVYCIFLKWCNAFRRYANSGSLSRISISTFAPGLNTVASMPSARFLIWRTSCLLLSRKLVMVMSLRNEGSLG